MASDSNYPACRSVPAKLLEREVNGQWLRHALPRVPRPFGCAGHVPALHMGVGYCYRVTTLWEGRAMEKHTTLEFNENTNPLPVRTDTVGGAF